MLTSKALNEIQKRLDSGYEGCEQAKEDVRILLNEIKLRLSYAPNEPVIYLGEGTFVERGNAATYSPNNTPLSNEKK